MFSQSADYSQSSNDDYNFLHNASQGSSQFEFDGTVNKNQNILGCPGELGTINEEAPLSPIKINYDDSKKSKANQNLSKSSKYSFGLLNANNNNKNNVNLNLLGESNIENNELKYTQKNINTSNNKENINIPNKIENNNNFFQLNFDSYKCQLSQQIDHVEKIASQSMSKTDSPNFNKANKIKEEGNLFMDFNSNNNINNNFSEEEILEHQGFNKYCSDLIDNALNKNIEYIENARNNFLNCLNKYQNNFKINAEFIKKLILLYSDDVFRKEKNKRIIAHLVDQLLSHINSFFQEMNKFNNFNINKNNVSCNSNENS